MDDHLSFSDALQAQARQLAPHALELISDLAAGRVSGYAYRIRPGTMLSAGKLVIALAAGALPPGTTAQDVENLERLRDLQVKRLDLAREAAAFDDLPKDKAVMAALGRILSESNIDAREFLGMDSRERQAFVDAARSQAQHVQQQAV